jgi:hypothetical protein
MVVFSHELARFCNLVFYPIKIDTRYKKANTVLQSDGKISEFITTHSFNSFDHSPIKARKMNIPRRRSKFFSFNAMLISSQQGFEATKKRTSVSQDLV